MVLNHLPFFIDWKALANKYYINLFIFTPKVNRLTNVSMKNYNFSELNDHELVSKKKFFTGLLVAYAILIVLMVGFAVFILLNEKTSKRIFLPLTVLPIILAYIPMINQLKAINKEINERYISNNE